MCDFKNKKFIAVIICVIGVFLILGFLAEKNWQRNIALNSGYNRLAQIMSIETGLLRKWQQSGALKNNLAYKSEGNDVILLQRLLSQDQNIYPEKMITGYYGNATVNAVKNFQKDYGLEKTGIVDSETRKKINNVFLSHLCPEPSSTYPEFIMRKISEFSPLPSDYAPPLLEDISDKIKTIGIACLRADIIQYLTQMFTDAKNDGVVLMVTSGYRKPEIQKYLYDFWISVEGYSAIDAIAKPGLSEHQLGSAVDLTDASIGFAGVDLRFASGKGGRWLQKNAYKYGFIMSFPDGKKSATGFRYEPWHYRFVDKEAAKFLRGRNLSYNEANFNENKPLNIKDNISGLTLSADSFISIFAADDGREQVLIEKNKDRQLPIASITKLMTASVASGIYKPDDIVFVSEKSLNVKGISGIYKAGDRLLFSDALRALLIASHNEIADAIAEQAGKEKFLDLMNKKASELELSGTQFINAIGTDPETGSDSINNSTASDLYKLAKYIQKNQPGILPITTKEEFRLFDADGNFVATVKNTDKLIGQNIPFRIIGGKTGETPRAKQNLVLVTESPCGGKLFNIMLGSQDNFGDMEKLLRYVNESYNWNCSPQ